jgi:predicted DNA-binding transcriptional regulator AlpA
VEQVEHQRKVFRTREAATYVGLAASTLEKMRLTGDGPVFIKAGPKAVVYDCASLDAWLNSRQRRSTSEAA